MQTFRLLHIADVHLGGSQKAFGERISAHQQRIEAAFSRCIDLAIDRRVDAVCIAGDLFVVPQPSERAVQIALRQLRRLAGATPPIPCFILPANHDCLGPGCVYHRPELSMDGVHIWRSPGPSVFHLAGGAVAIHGKPQVCGQGRHYALDGIGPDTGARFNIAVAHAAVRPTRDAPDACLVTPDEIGACGMDYVAFGHWHNPSDQSKGRVVAAFSGSPEILAVDQRDRGQAIIVSFSDNAVALEHVVIGQLYSDTLELDVETHSDEASLAAVVASRADPDLLLDVVIGGLAPEGFELDALRLQDEMADRFFRLRVRDDSVATAEQLEAGGVAGRFVATRAVGLLAQRIARAEEVGDHRDARLARQALRLVLALLHGREVLS